MKEIYLDHAATTPIRPEVLEAMLPYLQDRYGNASSVHTKGRTAKNALDTAKEQMASLVYCDTNELILTSSGTESNNMAIFSAVQFTQQENVTKKHIITSMIEHHAVLNACKYLENYHGYRITYLPVNHHGQVSVKQAAEAITSETLLISIMYGNNEVGTIQPILQLAELAKEHNVLFHVDGVQALGDIAIDLSSLPVDYMSFSAHKINGPKGIGLLFARRKAPVFPMFFGGSQENKRRPGTENIAGAVGFSEAMKLVIDNQDQRVKNMNTLRETMLNILHKQLEGQSWMINGHPTNHLSHILNVSFPKMKTEMLLMNLDLSGVYASSGSACTSGSIEVSHVLKAMKLPEDQMASAIRFSFGYNISTEQADTAATITASILQR